MAPEYVRHIYCAVAARPYIKGTVKYYVYEFPKSGPVLVCTRFVDSWLFEVYRFYSPLLFMGLISPLDDWCEDILVFELGVVEIPEWGDPGLTSLLPKFDLELPLFSALMFGCELGPSLELLEAFCWANRSCLRNFALLF